MDHGSVTVLNLHNPVQLKHHHARQGRGLKHHVVGHTACNSIDERQVPCVLVSDFTLKHGHVRRRGSVIKVDDERQGTVLIEEQRVVMVTLDHVPDAVAVSVNGGLDPPALFLLAGFDGWHAHRGHGQGKHQQAEDGQNDEALGGRLRGHGLTWHGGGFKPSHRSAASPTTLGGTLQWHQAGLFL